MHHDGHLPHAVVNGAGYFSFSRSWLKFTNILLNALSHIFWIEATPQGWNGCLVHMIEYYILPIYILMMRHPRLLLPVLHCCQGTGSKSTSWLGWLQEFADEFYYPYVNDAFLFPFTLCLLSRLSRTGSTNIYLLIAVYHRSRCVTSVGTWIVCVIS